MYLPTSMSAKVRVGRSRAAKRASAGPSNHPGYQSEIDRPKERSTRQEEGESQGREVRTGSQSLVLEGELQAQAAMSSTAKSTSQTPSRKCQYMLR